MGLPLFAAYIRMEVSVGCCDTSSSPLLRAHASTDQYISREPRHTLGFSGGSVSDIATSAASHGKAHISSNNSKVLEIDFQFKPLTVVLVGIAT